MKKKKVLISLLGGSSFLLIVIIMPILISVLIIFNFFGTKLTKEKIQSNSDYATEYKQIINNHLSNGYVPLQRLLYFYLEDSSLTLETLYTMNQDKDEKTTKDISKVCKDQRVINMGACTNENIEDNKEYLDLSVARFNLPLDKEFIVTSFFNEQRKVFGENNIHTGWDLAVSAETPVYSVCSGTVERVLYTQKENVPYNQSKNNIGNIITIKCDEDYDDTYYVTYAHLYPNSSKVKVGDRVHHWTEIASVGTTGHSTGNHLHYQVENINREKLDGMKFIDLSLKSPYEKFEPDPIIPKPFEDNEIIIQ